MCQSVLPKQAARKFANTDLEPKDKGIAEYVGEDEELVWTRKGLDSSLGRAAWAQPGEVVDDGFLRYQPLTVQEGLKEDYWKVQKKPGSLIQISDSTNRSFLQMKQTGGACNEAALNQQNCPDVFKKIHRKACTDEEKWQFFPLSLPACLSEENPKQVDTPQACLDEDKNNDDVKAWYFKYDATKAGTPIQCYTYKSECKPKVLKKRLTSVKDHKKDFNYESVTFWSWKGA